MPSKRTGALTTGTDLGTVVLLVARVTTESRPTRSACARSLRCDQGLAIVRRIVERQFSYPDLKISMVETYQAIARQTKNKRALSILENSSSNEKENYIPVCIF